MPLKWIFPQQHDKLTSHSSRSTDVSPAARAIDVPATLLATILVALAAARAPSHSESSPTVDSNSTADAARDPNEPASGKVHAGGSIASLATTLRIISGSHCTPSVYTERKSADRTILTISFFTAEEFEESASLLVLVLVLVLVIGRTQSSSLLRFCFRRRPK